MVGITSYGAYIPWYRLSRKAISAALGWFNPATLPGEKAVANFDEDSLTLAVAAALDCLRGFGREKISGLYFASTTAPYKERQSAAIISTALNLNPALRTADFTDSVKSGTTALLAACDALKNGETEEIILCAADCRLGKAGSIQEQIFGDGAAAFLLGKEEALATFEGSYSLSFDFIDHRRAEGDRFDRSWEDRWIRDVGYSSFIPEAISGLLNKYSLKISDFTKIAYACPYGREQAVIGRKLGARPEQIQENMVNTVGDSGTAYPLLMLIAALEEAKPGDKILVASYGNGSDVLFFQATENIEEVKKGRKGVKGHLARRKELTNYEKYAAFRNLIPLEVGIRGEEITFSPLSFLWRERKAIFGLCGSKCKRCGTPQFPPQRVCVNPECGAVDETEDYSFSNKKGRIFTYTGDNLAASLSPPAIYGLVDFEGGGRYWFDFTDCELDSLKVDLPVEMSFRRKYFDEKRGIHSYFWKAVPTKE